MLTLNPHLSLQKHHWRRKPTKERKTHLSLCFKTSPRAKPHMKMSFTRILIFALRLVLKQTPIRQLGNGLFQKCPNMHTRLNLNNFSSFTCYIRLDLLSGGAWGYLIEIGVVGAEPGVVGKGERWPSRYVKGIFPSSRFQFDMDWVPAWKPATIIRIETLYPLWNFVLGVVFYLFILLFIQDLIGKWFIKM